MDKSWLLTPKVVNLVNQMRRQISAEFGDSLSLTDDDIRSRLADYASRTRNPGLKKSWHVLKEELGEADLSAPKPETQAPRPRRMYRGRPIYTEEPGDASEDAQEHRPQQMYRGQPVHG